MADFNKLLVHKLDAPLARYIEHLDLWLYQKIKGEFRNEQARSRPSGVADGGSYVEDREIGGRVDSLERVSKNGIEDVVDPRTTTKFFSRDVG